MHICGDEIMALATLIPFAAVALSWLRVRIFRR